MPGFRPAWLIVTEMGIDSRMPMGKAMAHMARVFAELERDPRTPLPAT
jgi:DNA invertase Pin-like site-specific DNA recombinase